MLSGSGRILRARGRLTSVQQETKAELVINLKTAKALSLKDTARQLLPLLLCADEIQIARFEGAGLIENEAAIVLQRTIRKFRRRGAMRRSSEQDPLHR